MLPKQLVMGLALCVLCAASASAQLACPRGKVAKGEDCVTCPAGQAKDPDNDSSTDAVCKPAAQVCGTSEIVSNGICNPCGYGKIANADRSACQNCTAGTAKDPNWDNAENSLCLPAADVCGSSEIAVGGNCVTCGYGKVGNAGRTACVTCPVGQAKSPDNDYTTVGECKPAVEVCGTGAVAVNGRCLPCGVGKAGNADRTACITCPSGQAKSPDNYYDESASCKPASEVCDTAQVAVNGSCVTCGVGKVGNTARTVCVTCPAGQAKTPNDWYTASASCKTAGDVCGTGAFASNGSCWACTFGKVGNADRTACETCPTGYVKDPANDYDTSASCKPASKVCGTSSIAVNGICVPCGVAKVANTDRTACVTCGTGLVKSPNNDYSSDAKCVTPGGTTKGCGTNEIAVSGSCQPCSEGKVPNSARTSCVVCKAGYVKSPDNNYDSNAKCVAATAGCGTGQIAVAGRCAYCSEKTVPSKDRTKCVACPVGSVKVPYNNYSPDAKCVDARLGGCGTNQIVLNGECKPCGRGQIPISSTECGTCPEGRVKTPDTDYHQDAECVPPRACGSNEVAGRSGSCVPCGPGKVPVSDTDCGTCEDGYSKWPDNDYTPYAMCLPGRMACGTNQVARNGRCSTCTYGRVGDTNTDCATCPTGKVKVPDDNYSANAACVRADEGCGTNQYAQGGRCVACGNNMIPKADRTGCEPCPAGKVKVPNDSWSTNARCMDP